MVASARCFYDQRQENQKNVLIEIVCHKRWLSKANFTWLRVLSHRYVVLLHDYAVACHRLVIISWLFGCATSWCASSYMYLTHDLGCRSCGFAHVTQSGTWLVYCFMMGQRARRQWLIGVSWLVSHYDSLESWGRVTHRYESPGLGFVGGLGYIKRPPGAV